MDKTRLGARMKEYEFTSKTRLLRRMPVIIRLDGICFHSWTKQLKHHDPSLKREPWGDLMPALMTETTAYLMEHIQNAVFAYSQSDEISILLNDWKTLKTDQWLGGVVQKIVSTSASLATVGFNFRPGYISKLTPACFDARVYNLPKEEVANYFIWRQQDATRNSIQSLGRFYFSHNQLYKKNQSNIQDMLMEKHGVNWNDVATAKKRGFCVTSEAIDKEIPIFTQDRNYIEQHLGEESE